MEVGPAPSHRTGHFPFPAPSRLPPTRPNPGGSVAVEVALVLESWGHDVGLVIVGLVDY
jgi:hypothetical protein